MTWTTTSDAATFLQVAGQHLTSDRVALDPLLTEADHWAALDPPRDGGLFGWWDEGGSVTSAFVLLPGHALLCSRLTGEQTVALAALSTGATTWGIDGRDADSDGDSLEDCEDGVDCNATPPVFLDTDGDRLENVVDDDDYRELADDGE